MAMQRHHMKVGGSDQKKLNIHLSKLILIQSKEACFITMLQIPDDMESATAKELWEKSHGLPVWRKICFAIGGAPYQITSTVLGFFMSIFLLEVAQVIHVGKKIS